MATKKPISASPGWAETTCRWVNARHSRVYPSVSAGLPFAKVLLKILVNAKYMHFEMVDKRSFSKARWEAHLSNISGAEPSEKEWGRSDHAKLTKFLDAGGHAILMDKEVTEKVRVGVIGSDVLEEIELEMDDLEEAVAKVEGVKKPQRSPKHELEEVVAEEMLRLDPRFGVW